MNTTEWNHHLIIVYIPLDIFLVLFMVIGLLGNGVVIYVYGYKIKRIKDGQYFIPRLAFNDMLGCIVCSLFGLSTTLMPVMYSSDIVCKIGRFLSSVFVFISVFLLFVIAIQRYYRICKGKRPVSDAKRRGAVIIVCFWGVTLALPFLTSSGLIPLFSPHHNVSGTGCGSLFGVGPFIFDITLGIVIPLSYIAFILLYTVIGYKTIQALGRSQFLDNGIRRSVNPPQERRKSNFKLALTELQIRNRTITSKLTIMFMIITLSFVVCTIPKMIILFLEMFVSGFWEQFTDTERLFLMFVRHGYILYFIVNPFVYAFLDKSFREHLPKIFQIGDKT